MARRNRVDVPSLRVVDRQRPVGRVRVDATEVATEPDGLTRRVRATCQVDDDVVVDDDVRVAPIGMLVPDEAGEIVREHQDPETGEVTSVERFRLVFRAATEAEVVEDLAWLAEQRAVSYERERRR